MTWYTNNVYGHISGISGIAVLGWASDPGGSLIATYIQGSSSAISAVIAKARMGKDIPFVPEGGAHTIYGKTATYQDRQEKQYKYNVFPNKPLIMPNGDIQRAIVRVEDPKIASYLCYVNDEKAESRFINVLHQIVDYPVHPSWAKVLMERGKTRQYGRDNAWGACNEVLNFRSAQDGTSKLGIQMCFVKNHQSLWEDIITNELKFKRISLPEESDGKTTIHRKNGNIPS